MKILPPELDGRQAGMLFEKLDKIGGVVKVEGIRYFGDGFFGMQNMALSDVRLISVGFR